MKTLVIPDIHLKMRQAEIILGTQEYDQAVFLGDFFDDFNDGRSMNAKMAMKLNEWMTKDNYHFLYGNHDVHYIWNMNREVRCSGFSGNKSKVINAQLEKRLVWRKFRWHKVVDGWLLSHAGLHPSFTPLTNVDEISKWLDDEEIDAHRLLAQGCSPWFTDAGRCRGGFAEIGGIVWCDAHDEFKPIKGVKQLFGHTFCGTEMPKWIDDQNIDLDTNLNHFAIIDDGKIEIHGVELLV